MTERLSPQEDNKAKFIGNIYKQYGESVLISDELNTDIEAGRVSEEVIADHEARQDRQRKDPNLMLPENSTFEDDNRARLDAAVAMGTKHKDEHLGEYIETARQEAEAQNIHTNLEPPKE